MFPGSKKIKIYGFILIAAVSFTVFAPTVSNVYIYDDEELVGENLKNLSFSDSLRYFSTSMFGSEERGPLYRPFLELSLWLDKTLFGHEAFSYHFVNLLLHILVSSALFYIFSLFWGWGIPSLTAATVFALLPVHVESLAFIVNRADILAALFLLISFIILARDGMFNGGYIKAIAASAFFLFAVLSKESAVPAFGLVLLMILYRLKEKGWRQYIPILAGFSVALLLYLAMRSHALSGPVVSENALFKTRKFGIIFPTVSRVFMDYLVLIVCPSRLMVDYSNYRISTGFFDPFALLSYLVHIGLLVFGLLQIRKGRAVGFMVVAFYIFLLPVSQLIPFLDIKAERFLYIPSIFYAAIVGQYLFESSGLIGKRTLVLFCVLISLFYGAITAGYSSYFGSPVSLWTEMTRRDPSNFKFRYNLGLSYWKEMRYEQAIGELKAVVDGSPGYYRAYSPLATSYSVTGDFQAARKVFIAGLKIAPEHFPLVLNWAVFNLYHGDLKIAAGAIEKALHIAPGNPKALAVEKEIRAGLSGKKTR